MGQVPPNLRSRSFGPSLSNVVMPAFGGSCRRSVPGPVLRKAEGLASPYWFVRNRGGWIRRAPNEGFQPTKPLVTALAYARPAPNAFAAEADVR